MTALDLAPRHASKQSSSHCSDNPFASPLISTHILAAPQPCAQPSLHHHDRRPSQAPTTDGSLHERYASTDYSSGGGGGMYKKGSVSSSTAASSIVSPISSFENEKASVAKEQPPRHPSRESRRSGGRHSDPEKAMPRGSPHSSRHSHTRHAPNTVEFEDDGEDEVDEARATQEKKAVNILFFLAGPCVALSTLNALWAILAIFITALSQPIRICAKRPSFGQQLSGLLGPTLNLQLRCIYTPLPPHANEDRSYHNGTLLLTHLLSPFLSFPIIFAAWGLTIYWVCSGMVGDPAGQDKRDDGKETVLGLRNFWETWLMRSVKED